MKAFSQARSALKKELGNPGAFDEVGILMDEFACDSRQNDSIGLAVMSFLVQSWNVLEGIPQFVFMNRDYSTVLVGFGAADRIEEGMPVFTGCRFDEREASVETTPRVLLSTSKARWPIIQIRVVADPTSAESRGEAIQILDSLSESFIPGVFKNLIPGYLTHKDVGLDKEVYKEKVSELLTRISSEIDCLEKVVVSRQVRFELDGSVNPFALLNEVISSSNISDDGKRYIVLIKERCGKAFLSLTPERLCLIYSRGELETEALAGTWTNSTSSGMTCKIVNEHEFVSRHVYSMCSEIGNPRMDHKETVELGDFNHCREIFSVEQNSEIKGVKALLDWSMRRLHPTPAVAGFPRQEAIESVLKTENFERGFFAGTFGYYDLRKNEGELCVLLRCASVEKNYCSLFAGAGIVEGSIPDEEWEEMELKMKRFRSILLNENRILAHPLPNASACFAAFAIESLVKHKVSLFVICPGSRSSPLTCAVHRNSAANSVIIHDERSAGFYALGAARAGALSAVIVTSGTAVANLVPAVCEAREAGLPLILLTADRPARSWDVGENQTVKQLGIFSHIVGFQKSFTSPISASSTYFYTVLVPAMMADVSFATAEIAGNRKQTVQLNFEFEKSDLELTVPGSDFRMNHFLKIKNNLFTAYPEKKKTLFTRVPSCVARSIAKGTCLFVVGELRNPNDAIAIKYFIDKFHVACIAEALSLIPPGSNNTVSWSDPAFPLPEIISDKLECIVRMGGPLVSAFLEAHIAREISYIRVSPETFPRHDPHYAADVYIDSHPSEFLDSVSCQLEGKTIRPCNTILQFFRHVSESVHAGCTAALNAIPEFNEPAIAHAVSQCKKGASFFLSSSMPCRDFSTFGWPNKKEDSSWPYRLVSANRGANGIDGVISTACGFSASVSGTTFLLIGDVAALRSP